MGLTRFQKLVAWIALAGSVVAGNVALVTDRKVGSEPPQHPPLTRMSDPVPLPQTRILQEFAEMRQEEIAPSVKKLRKILEASIKPLNLDGDFCKILMKGVEKELAALTDLGQVEDMKISSRRLLKSPIQILTMYLDHKKTTEDQQNLLLTLQEHTEFVRREILGAYIYIEKKQEEYFPKTPQIPEDICDDIPPGTVMPIPTSPRDLEPYAHNNNKPRSQPFVPYNQ